MTSDRPPLDPIVLARRLQSDLAEFGGPSDSSKQVTEDEVALEPGDDLIVEFDRRIIDEDLRASARSRFVSGHYADAVEAGVKTLNEVVRARTGGTEDGDPLMTLAFSPNSPQLRINKGRSKSEESEQRGHMMLCQGVVGAWRNPRAHSLIDDSPKRALMMLETIDDLLATTRAATRTRRRRSKSP